jgi:hypothetical protein
VAEKIDLPFEKHFFLKDRSGSRRPCSLRILPSKASSDGHYEAILECAHLFRDGYRVSEVSRKACLASLFQGLRDVLRGLEFSCENEDGSPLEFPTGNEIDPDYLTEEDLIAFVNQLKTKDSE